VEVVGRTVALVGRALVAAELVLTLDVASPSSPSTCSAASSSP
jgi:hypothetical protein